MFFDLPLLLPFPPAYTAEAVYTEKGITANRLIIISSVLDSCHIEGQTYADSGYRIHDYRFGFRILSS